jgi:SOS-response transcriptional repressor LexA
MKFGLTPRQQEIYDALVLHHETTGQMPTIRELATACTSWPGSIHALLRSLEDKGWISRLEGRERGIALID